MTTMLEVCNLGSIFFGGLLLDDDVLLPNVSHFRMLISRSDPCISTRAPCRRGFVLFLSFFDVNHHSPEQLRS